MLGGALQQIYGLGLGGKRLAAPISGRRELGHTPFASGATAERPARPAQPGARVQPARPHQPFDPSLRRAHPKRHGTKPRRTA